jgi:hypothetical protein
MTKLEHALKLASLGFWIFPCKATKKEPLEKGWQEKATRDPDKIKEIWTKYSFANIGIFTGKFGDGSEALCGIDVDNKPDPDPEKNRDGIKVFSQLEATGHEFPETLCQETPSRGFHVIYRCPHTVTGGNNKLGEEIGKGIDVKSYGGILIGAGSDFGKGVYVLIERPLAPCPEWILDKLEKAHPVEKKAKETLPGIDSKRAVERALQFLENLQPIHQGERNDMGFLTACRIKDLGADQESCFDLMLKYWKCEPMVEFDELSQIVQSAYSYGRDPVGFSAPEVEFNDPLTQMLSGEDLGEIREDDFPLETTQSKEVSSLEGPSLSPIERLNEHFAFVIAGGDSHILWETTNAKNQYHLEHLSIKAFHEKFASELHVSGDGKAAPLTKVWMRHPKRRSYDGICFMPEVPIFRFSENKPEYSVHTHSEKFFNLWRGFAVKPPKDKDAIPAIAHEALKNFLDLVLHAACGSSKWLFDWLMGYFAHLIQKPYEKPLVAVVFKGAKGVGKDTIAETIGHLLGVHYMMTANRRYLTGNFNGHLENLLLFVLNEAFWSGDKQAEGILKDLITGKTHVIEHKGKSPYTIDNLTRIIIIGNEAWLVSASQDERRYAVFDFSSKYQKDKAFFQELHDGMKVGGYELLLDYLQKFDLTNIDLNTAPSTEGLLEQKLNSLEPFPQWWMDCLSEGRIVSSDFSEQWPDEIDREAFRGAFRRYCKERQIRTRVPDDRAIGKLIKVYVPGLDDTARRREGHTRIYVYRLPELHDCRAEFEKYIGHSVKW